MTKIKQFLGREDFDELLNPRYWRNDDKRQTHAWIASKGPAPRVGTGLSFELRYPGLYHIAPKRIVCKPGKVTLIPHWGYYDILTRDGKPAKGTWFVGETIEDAAPSSLSKGDAFGQK